MTIAINTTKSIARLTCDQCGLEHSQTVPRQEFRRLAGIARTDGWSVEKHAGDWQHFCPACARTRTPNRKGPTLL